MKKLVAWLLVFVFVFAGCSPEGPTEPTATDTTIESTEEKATESSANLETVEVDVVVVGAGGGGLSAALEAVAQGAESVALIEKLPMSGGSLNTTAGTISAAKTKIQEADGLTEDSFESYKADLINEGEKQGGFVDTELLDIYISGAQEMVDFLWDNGLSEYEFRTDEQGHKSVIAPEHTPYSYPRSYKPIPKNPEKYRSATHEILDGLVNNEKKIHTYFNTKATELLRDESNRVLWVKAQGQEGEFLFKANRGIVMATGGYSGNEALIKHFNDEIQGIITGGMKTADGYGLYMMQKVGAALYDETMGWVPTFPMGLENPEAPGTGNIMTTKTQFLGGILVNKDGKRFVNETDADNVVREHALERQPDGIQWEIYTDKIIEDLMQTPQKVMYEFFFATEKGAPYIVEAASLEELAEKMDVNKDNFLETVKTYNEHVETDTEDEFGRVYHKDDNIFNLAINKIEGDKFYGVKTKPIALLTLGGVKANHQMNVLDVNGNPIPGLYAAGEVVGGQWGRNVSSGVGVTGPLVFGRQAVRSMFAQAEVPAGEIVENPNLLDLKFFETQNVSEEYFDMNQVLKDGVYEAEVEGQEGPMKVSTEISDGKIHEVKILEHNETPSMAEAALEEIPVRIVSGNTPNVDTISGATYTSDRIIHAVVLCLEQAVE